MSTAALLVAASALLAPEADAAPFVWATPTGGAVTSSPAVAGGLVYVGSADRRLYAINATSGEVVWSALTGGSIDSSPAVVDGFAYVGSDDGRVSALVAATGQFAWQTITGGPVDSSPAVVNGVVYVGSDDGALYALNAAIGSLVWKTYTGGAIDSSPTVANGVVYVGSDDGGLYALNAATGQVVWKTLTFGAVNSSPTVVNGVVYVGSANGFVYALNAATGQILWQAFAGGAVDSSPTVLNGVVYVGSDAGVLFALDAATGQTLWQTFTLGAIDSTPAVVNGVAYVGSDDAFLYALDAFTGQILWQALTGGAVNSSPAVANGLVYVGSDVNLVFALDAVDRVDVPEPTTLSLIGIGLAGLGVSRRRRRRAAPSRFAGMVVVAAMGSLPAVAWADPKPDGRLCRADVDIEIFSDSAPGTLVDTVALSYVPASISTRDRGGRPDSGLPLHSTSEMAIPAGSGRGAAAIGALTGRPYLFSLQMVSLSNAPSGRAGITKMRATWRLSEAKGGLVFSYGSQTIDVLVKGDAVVSKFSGRITGEPFAAQMSADCDLPLYVPNVSSDGSDITFNAVSYFRGTLTASPRGLVPAVTLEGTVAQDPNQSFVPGGAGTTFFDVEVPAGTTYVRLALFDAFTDGSHDLDLYLYRPSRHGDELIESSLAPHATETIQLSNPEPGTYRLWVHGYATDGPEANFTLFTWIMGGSAGNMSVVVPSSVTHDLTFPITVSFTGLAPATNYLGMILYGLNGESPSVGMFVTVDTP